MSPTVVAIYIAKTSGQPMIELASADVAAAAGIAGDRYHSGHGKFSQKLKDKGEDDWQITLIEAEEIDAFNAAESMALDYGEFRRNIITRGVRLNDLVGKRFTVDGVELEGIRLCEPCAYLADLLTDRLLPSMVGRSGLRCRVLTDGNIQPGSHIEI